MILTNVFVIGIVGFVLLILNAVFIGVIYFMRKKMATVSQWPSTAVFDCALCGVVPILWYPLGQQ